MKKKNPFQVFKEIHSLEELLSNGYKLSNSTIQNIDFTASNVNWHALELGNAVFLGCNLKTEDKISILKKGAVIFPQFPKLVYNPYRSSLYTWQELYRELSPNNSVDLEIYEHFSKHKYSPSMMEALCQRIHDNSIDDALRDLLKPDINGNYKIKSIGIMGGHSTERTDHYYLEVAKTAQLLAKNGYLVISGGGPGIMEAANLGAYMAKYTQSDLIHAVTILQEAPHYTHKLFHHKSTEILKKFPLSTDSLAIPTWFYGHEPSNVFASHIAKYFSNSIREDTLLAICIHGILFAPGSAGTTQEIFMDAAQNHYTTFDYVSPMIFLGKERYAVETNLFETLKHLSKNKEYSKLIHLVDSAQDALIAFQQNPPYRVDK